MNKVKYAPGTASNRAFTLTVMVFSLCVAVTGLVLGSIAVSKLESFFTASGNSTIEISNIAADTIDVGTLNADVLITDNLTVEALVTGTIDGLHVDSGSLCREDPGDLTICTLNGTIFLLPGFNRVTVDPYGDYSDNFGWREDGADTIRTIQSQGPGGVNIGVASDSQGDDGQLTFTKSAGTPAEPAAVVGSDEVGTILWRAVNPLNTTSDIAQIKGTVYQEPNGSVVQGQISVSTADSLGDMVTRLLMNDEGVRAAVALIVGAAIRYTGVVTPSLLPGGTINDYDPPGLSTANVLRLSTLGASTLTSIVAQPAGTRITLISLSNSASDTITLYVDDGNLGVAENRFLCTSGTNPGNVVIPPRGAVDIIYDGTLERWYVLSLGDKT